MDAVDCLSFPRSSVGMQLQTLQRRTDMLNAPLGSGSDLKNQWMLHDDRPDDHPKKTLDLRHDYKD